MDSPDLIFQLGGGVLAAITLMLALGRGPFFQAGRLVQEVQDLRLRSASNTESVRNQLDKMEHDQQEFYKEYYATYHLSLEDARVYLHRHDSKDPMIILN